MELGFLLLFMGELAPCLMDCKVGVQVSVKNKKYYGHYKLAQRAQVLNLIKDTIEHTSYLGHP